MADDKTITVHNPLDTAQKLVFERAETHTIPAHGDLTLPLHRFRAVFHVRCEYQKCCDAALPWCTKGHAELIVGAMAPALTDEAKT